MDKIKIFCVSLLLIFYSSFSVAHSGEADFCNAIAGTWTGNWIEKNTNCIWSMDVKATKSSQAVKLYSKYKSKNGCKPDYHNSLLEGTCTNGELELHYYSDKESTYIIKGTVTDAVLALENGYILAVLYKDK